MTGNVYVMLAIAKALVSLLPTVGPAAAHRSRVIVRRTSDCRAALISKVNASQTRADRSYDDAVGSNAACAGEVLSP